MKKFKQIAARIGTIYTTLRPVIVLALGAATAFGIIAPDTATALRDTVLGL